MMSANGLTKLVEECGELVQICAKKMAYYHSDEHPDGKGSMKQRMTEEMGDVLAAIHFVATKFDISVEDLIIRKYKKLDLFEDWDASTANIADGYDFSGTLLKETLATLQFEQKNLSHISEINGDLRKKIRELESK